MIHTRRWRGGQRYSPAAASSPGESVPEPTWVPVVHHLEPVMGTVVTIDIYARPEVDPTELSPCLAGAVAVLHRADRIFTTWDPASPMSRLRSGVITAVEAPPVVTEVLDRCMVARRLSGGWFDPWAMPGGLDPTGFVKGWAAQAALDALRSPVVSAAIVNAAGDITSFGGIGPGSPFRFGIVDPLDTSRLACVVEKVAALATSGTYERGAHLIDPHTGRAGARVASASVTGPDLGLADALATAVSVSGDAGLVDAEGLEDYEAMTISYAGRRVRSAGFRSVPPSAQPLAGWPVLTHAPRGLTAPGGHP